MLIIFDLTTGKRITDFGKNPLFPDGVPYDPQPNEVVYRVNDDDPQVNQYLNGDILSTSANIVNGVVESINIPPKVQLELSVTPNGNSYAITANLINGTTQTSADFVIAGTTFTQPLTNNQASIAVSLDEVVANQTIEVRATATGCIDGVITIGGDKKPSQFLLAKAQTDGSVLVKCTSKKEIKEYGLTINVPEEDREADEANMLDLLADGVFKLLQWAQNPTYAPLSLTADEQNTITDFVTNYKFRLQLHDANPLQGSATQQNPRYPLLLGDKPKANDAADKIRSRLFDSDTINP